MSHFIRQSKYRHVYVEQAKAGEKFENLRLSSIVGEQQYIKANTKFMAVAWSGGGGPVAILEHDKPRRIETSQPMIAGHKGGIYDFDFNPFHEHIIATGSDDSTVKVWGIPEAGLTEMITEPLVDLHGHGKKVTLLRFHRTASNVLASVSADQTVKLWDIEQQSDLFSFNEHTALIQDIQWNYLGNMYATSSKDKTVRMIDARDNSIAQAIPNCHEGARSMKITFTGESGRLLTVGFTRQSVREMKVWDPRNLTAPIKKDKIDQGSGVIFPFYDDDTNVVYLAGKGDGNIRYYECVTETPCFFRLSEFRSTVAAKGVTFLPKRGLDVLKCETARALKLTGNCIEPLKFIVPRKSDSFQEDIFPPTFGGIPNLTCEEWMDGLLKPPIKTSLDPSQEGCRVEDGSTPAPIQMKTRSQLQTELDAAKVYIETLKQILEEANIEVPLPSAAP